MIRSRATVPFAAVPLRSLLLVASALAASLATRAQATGGHTVGGGGDAVNCVPSPANPFRGYYALDYLATFQTGPGVPDIIAVPSWEAQVTRLRQNFLAKLPEMLPSFDDFVANIRNTSDFTKKRIWEEAPFGLIDLKDERLASLVPLNCRENGRAKIVQAVIRQDPLFTGRPPGTLVYKFVPSVLDNLQATNPVQLSFLYVHEWLWDLSQNVDLNRRVNRFLHSRALDLMNRAQIIAQLHGMGLIIPSLVPPVFLPQSCIPDPVGLAGYIKRFPFNRQENPLVELQSYGRRRSCEIGVGCSNVYRDTSADLKEAIGSHNRFVLRNDHGGGTDLFLWGGERYQSPLTVNFNCVLGAGGTLNCDTLKRNDGLFWRRWNMGGADKNMRFSGVMSADCVRLTAVGKDRVYSNRGDGFIDEEEFVLFGRLPNPAYLPKW